MATVIIGAGIIGTSTAYYLSQTSKNTIHLVEVSPQLFASASGFAAGFLARDWFSPSLSKLGELSFDLHRQLAEDNNGQDRWGYSQSTGTSLAETVGKNGADWLMEGVSRSTAAARTTNSNVNRPAWLTPGSELDVMSDGSTTAQCDPLLLCRFLLESCQFRGVRLYQPAKAVSITRSPSGTLSNITILNTSTQERTTLPCTRLVLAAGAWTPQVHRTLFPKSKLRIPITSLAGHSLILRSPHWSPPALDSTDPANAGRHGCHAVFTTDAEADYSPEIFSRMPDGCIYLAGLNSSTYPLPKIANERVVDDKSIAVLKKTAHKLLRDDFEVVREGVCWRPVARKGVPVIADLGDRGEEGVIVCAGHGPWGISNSLGSGYCVAKMVEGKNMERFVGRLGL
ncbi:MAG: hypothetical protein ALECFALPRED_006288 [Alectoria fallacina]|uniref:FAD dependent oxidoreductase domain-containing protein n=1 Tax=Alectoria fallacina TaxID=1903189 RepID=A0A8H3EMW4_9LECA|nr:MAG: hypothetical protein ALECFALPRED_006288 [Alectoria fallacina]